MENKFNGKLDRRKFLAISTAVGAGLFLMPFPRLLSHTPRFMLKSALSSGAATTSLVNGPISAEEAGGMEVLIALARKERAISTIVPLPAWANHGQLFEAFKVKYPFLTMIALVPEESELL